MSESKYRVDRWLKHATDILDASGVPIARLDALILLEDALGQDRAWILANPEFDITHNCERTDLSQLEEKVKRRAGHEPLAYIRGKSEFYGRTFKVTPATLQPRPETETMISLFGKLIRTGDWGPGTGDKAVVDVGTGSGCIAITAKLEFPELKILATEINDDALKVAKENSKILNAEVKFFHGNLLEPLFNLLSPVSSPFAILANLPYVPDSHTINQAAMQEPKIAIFGGEDGLDLYREMFSQLKPQLSNLKPQYILTECLPFQHLGLQKLALSHGYKLMKSDDFIQVFIKV
jgi:release factor glutamine methyltransferase